MQKYTLLILLLVSSLFASQNRPVNADEIERMVTAFLEPAAVTRPLRPAKDHKAVPVQHQSRGGYYVQMGAFTQTKPVALLRTLHEKGYHVYIKKTVRHGEQMHLVLVGAYNDRESVERQLSYLRNVVPGAFVYQAKK